MTVTEKIFAMHAVDSKGYVKTGETIRVSLDWIMASEASWAVRQISNLASQQHKFSNKHKLKHKPGYGRYI
jgi:homoaconitase/3-isopropylmalate dehydratase large subunit